MRVLFVDTAAYKPYDANTLQKEALGGSEASLIRVARGLARRGHEVAVFQLVDAHRDEATIQGVKHVNDEAKFPADVVVHFRSALTVEGFTLAYPNARHVVWCQDFFVPESCEGMEGVELVLLSKAHEIQAVAEMQAAKVTPRSITRIYNMVEVDGQCYDPVPGRWGFFSSPHKGLDEVTAIFSNLIQGRELVVGNPGYIRDTGIIKLNKVTYLGELSHPRVMEELSKCDLLFYPQTVFPETFGIVLAEANAMGVPVLAHDFGAAREVLSQPGNAVVDCTKPGAIEAALNQLGPVSLDLRFTEKAVIDAWEKLLNAQEE